MEDSIEQFTKLPAPVVLTMAFYILGLALKMTKLFPNRFIPITICLSATAFYPLISSDERIGFTYANIKPMMFVYGFMIGAGAVAANEILRNIPMVGPFLEKVQDAFKNSGSSNGDTTIITKEKTNEKNNDSSKSNPS